MPNISLDGLNDAQLQAILHPPHIPLQILAGPGSGKTKVLTTRIAYLITQHGIQPSSICAVTFTNKAALEMRARLGKLLSKEQVRQIKLGTFHALCARFVRVYAGLVGVQGNFTVCDADESKRIIKKFHSELFQNDFLKTRNIAMNYGFVAARISKAKATGLTPYDLLDIWTSARDGPHKRKRKHMEFTPLTNEDLETELETCQTKEIIDYLVAHLYGLYQRTLRENNALDFDDLLVYGVQLFGENPQVSRWCRHVLVDEFQDTNHMQYDLMRYLATHSQCVTIVGDPDQSIYGWRSAEVKNLAKMRQDFDATEQIMLEENYRSTASILTVSMAIISQDKKRIKKTLRATHAFGPKPVLHSFESEQPEGWAIACEVKRIVAKMGGVITYDDVAILLRYNSLSRVFESAFRREGIPTRLLGGQRFFERAEVKDLLAYLQLLDNPSFVPAFTRIINVPARTIGQKTVAEILAVAKEKGIPPLQVVERICEGKMPDIKPPVKRKAGDFVLTIQVLRKLAAEGEGPANLIRRLLEMTKYEDHLKKTYEDAEDRWENVGELITFATELEGDIAAASFDVGPVPVVGEEAGPGDGEWVDKVDDEFDEELDDLGFAEVKPKEAKKEKGKAGAAGAAEVETPLRAFLQASMLSTDTGQDGEDKNKPRVTIATCHAAKGLEWPVVFLPVVESGVFPATRAEDWDEERRLLYVACTRAQALLYLTYVRVRMNAGEIVAKNVSEFVSVLPDLYGPQGLFSETQPDINAAERELMAKVLHRPPPKEEDVERMVAEFERANRSAPWVPANVPRDQNNGFVSAAAPHAIGSGRFPTPFTMNDGVPAAPWGRLPQAGPSQFHEPKLLDNDGLVAAIATFVSARTSLNMRMPPSSSSNPRQTSQRPLSPSKNPPKPGPWFSASVPPREASPSENNLPAAEMKHTLGRTAEGMLMEREGAPGFFVSQPPGRAQAFERPALSSAAPKPQPSSRPATSHRAIASSSSSSATVSKSHQAARPSISSVPTPAASTSKPSRIAALPQQVRPPAPAPASKIVAPSLPSSASSTSSADAAAGPASSVRNPPPTVQQPVKLATGKRRLGMSRAVIGYPSKKFKTPGAGT